MCLLVGAFFALAPAIAFAQQRVVVEDFGGPQGSRMRAALIANLQEAGAVEIVSGSEVRSAARQLGIRRSTFRGDEYTQVAQALHVNAFIRGTVSRSRSGWTLTISVRSGYNGRIAGSATWSGRTVTALGAVRRNGHRRLARFISDTAPAEVASREEPREERPREDEPREGRDRPREEEPRERAEPPREEPRRPLRTDTNPDGTRPWYATGSGSWEGDTGDDDDDEVPEEEQIDFSRVDPNAFQEPGDDLPEDDGGDFDDFDDDFDIGLGDRIDWLNIGVLVGTLRRDMAAQAIVRNNGRDPTLDMAAQLEETRTYRSTGLGHGEVGIQAELYPGAIGDSQEIPWFGIVGSYRHSVFLSTYGCARDTPGCIDSSTNLTVPPLEVPTTQTELYIGGRARHRFDERPDAARVWADVGYGRFDFVLDPNQLVNLEAPSIVAPMNYSYVNLGAGASIGVVPTYLTLGVEAAYRFGLGVGTLAKMVWGVETQPGSGFSVGVHARSEAPYIAEGVFWDLMVQYFVFTTTFRGPTACVDMSDCNDFTDAWEPWPMENDSLDGPVTGGIKDPVTDAYLRIGLQFGYSFR